jgi:hypothetical protein
MNNVDQKIDEKFSDYLAILEDQNSELMDMIEDLDSPKDLNLCIHSSTTSIVLLYSRDILKKLLTVLDLLSEGKNSESAIILRSLIEDVGQTSYLVENHLHYREFLVNKNTQERRSTGEEEIETPQSIFNRNKEDIFEEIGEEKLYSLYKALSVVETHTGLQSLRDNVDVRGLMFKEDDNIDFRRTAGYIYIAYIVHERVRENMIEPVTWLCETESSFQSNRKTMNQLYDKYDLGNNI